EQNRGVFFRSTGWLERGEDLQQETLRIVRNKTGAGYTRDELVLRYGEDNGAYLFDELNAYQNAYRQLTYIATGLEPDDRFERQAAKERRGQGRGCRAGGGSPGLVGRARGGRGGGGGFSNGAAGVARQGHLGTGHSGKGAVVDAPPGARADHAIGRPARSPAA